MMLRLKQGILWYDHPFHVRNELVTIPQYGYFTQVLTEFGERSRSTNAPSRLRGVRGVRKEWVNHETVQHGSSRAQLQAVNKLASN